MQSSRDSSIWRNLAVAFGDGVAFGVGVKLAQGAAHPPAGAPPEESPSISMAGRLEQIERRLSTVENAPAPIAPPAPAPAPFDQKVLEAVVNALDARLHEQAGQVERRLTELEAKLAIDLKNLERQDHAIVTGLQGRLEEVHGQYNEHVTAIRDAVAQDMDVLYGQIAQLRQDFASSAGVALDQRIAAAVTAHLEARVATLESRLHGQIVDAMDRASVQVASAAAARVDEQLAAVHASLADKDREIAELRQRLAENEQTVLDLILSIGQMCRQVAERISNPTPESLLAATPAPSPAPSPAPVDQPHDGSGSDDDGPSTSASAAPPAESPDPPPAAEPPAAVLAVAAAPGEGDRNGSAPIAPMPVVSAQGPSRLWRIPLVSSFLILAIGSLWVLK